MKPLNLQNTEGLDMDVGTVQSPAVNVTMPAKGTPVPALQAPMGTCIGANGLILLRKPASLPFAPIVTFTAGAEPVPGHPCHGISHERGMFIPPKFSPPRETFGGINMDLSAHETLESAKYGGRDVGNTKRHGRAKGRTPVSCRSAAVSADGHLHRR